MSHAHMVWSTTGSDMVLHRLLLLESESISLHMACCAAMRRWFVSIAALFLIQLGGGKGRGGDLSGGGVQWPVRFRSLSAASKGIAIAGGDVKMSCRFLAGRRLTYLRHVKECYCQIPHS